MTPDIVHRWLLNYSDKNTNTRSSNVNQTKLTCRKFIRNLSIIIIDEAHAYEGAFGANMAYLIRRLLARRQELSRAKPLPLLIAASATILNPTEHLELLTGQPFEEITEDNNGSPKAPLTLQHVGGRTQGAGSEQDMVELIKTIIEENDSDTYIAYADDRQKVERIAAGIEPTRMVHEEDIIAESERSMPYRAGLQARELIEQKLKAGEIRGVVSTSALEMGIDIPELTVGINLGLPASTKRLRQRAGRVGRRTPGRFIILDDSYAFQFDQGGLEGYWNREIEPAKLYLSNRFLQRIHANCLEQEQDQKGVFPDMNWPEGFQAVAESGEKGETYNPELQTVRGQDQPEKKRYPHDHDLRSFADKQFSILTEGDSHPVTDMTKTEAMRELYTWATYHHAKQAYTVTAWHENGTDSEPTPHVILRLARGKNARTNRIMTSGATFNLDEAEAAEAARGILAYAGSAHATGTESIVGCSRLENEEDGREGWKEYKYANHPDTPDISRTTPTTMTLIQIRETWFQDQETRDTVIQALRDIMCHLDNIGAGDLMTAHENINLIQDDTETPVNDAVALWDRAYGGLGLARTLHDNLRVYTERLLEIAEDPTRGPESGLPLPLNTARLLNEWAQGIRGPEPEGIRPTTTTYQGVTFRSQLEARWAAWFDQKGIEWSYEPQAFTNWLPDFRIEVQGQETYAEVKPVQEFPENVAEKIDASSWPNQAMILGRTHEFTWIREKGEWRKVEQ